MPPSINAELQQLFQADQNARKNHPSFGTPEYDAFCTRDAQRRQRVTEIIAAGEAHAPEDFYYAALVLHHGGDTDEIRRAHTLAQQAAEMSYQPARWLTAATLDRWLMVQGKPQKYGTQIVPDGGRYRVWDVEPATRDSERAQWDVRPLEQQIRRAATLSKTEPIPPMDRAPAWLKAAINRWNRESGQGEPTPWGRPRE